MKYEDYLKTDEWKWKRQFILNFWGRRCALCDSNNSMHVHHRNYKCVGNESITDVIALCGSCHAKFHGLTAGQDDVVSTLDRIGKLAEAGIPT
jgi:5-methylcytosine-specific restriction endonuclease McrA